MDFILYLFTQILSQSDKLTALAAPSAIVETISPINTTESELATHDLNLNDRLTNPSGNKIFRDNILLYTSYLDTLDYPRYRVAKSFTEDETLSSEFVLNSSETFAFHSQLLPEYQNITVKYLNLKLKSDEGFEFFGGLMANGICHLASLMNWTAQDAGLTVVAPTNHSFYPIPDIPRQYGTSIYLLPQSTLETQKQNLYITNSYPFAVKFIFNLKDNILNLKIVKF